MTATMILSAPIKGWAAPLDEVPDPAFSGRMLGDGVAIDPTGDTVHAPFDGEVTTLASTRHAIAVRADNGVEVLIHIGLDTVALGGEGFELCVVSGQRVVRGERLGRFDLDRLAQRARSLVTPVLVTELAGGSISRVTTGRLVEVGEPLIELASVGAVSQAGQAPASAELRRAVRLDLPHGLHARPAGRLAQVAKAFAADIVLEAAGRRANAKSPTSLMGLGLATSQDVVLIANGVDAEAALDSVATVVASGLGEPAAPKVASPIHLVATPPHAGPHVPGELRGICAAPGLAVGRSFRFVRAEPVVVEAGKGVSAETAALDEARARVRSELEQAAASAQGDRRGIVEAHIALLDDDELVEAARPAIAAGKSAAFAWSAAIQDQAERLRALDDPRLQARADDLLDLRNRMLRALGSDASGPVQVPPGAIVLADDLLPSELMQLAETAAGFCTARGGPTSHVAILAAGAGLPLLVAVGDELLSTPDGAAVILDSEAGRLARAPSDSELAQARLELDRRRELRVVAERRAGELCRTADGVRIEVFANLGAVAEAAPAVAVGAEGCGLLRTEFLFLDRPDAPGEDEQAAVYQAIADALDGRPLIVRTLDIGGDKPTPYLPLPSEENPALGLRGVRTSLWRPDLLKTQLRAILRVAPLGRCRIMVPMVASVSELAAVRVLLDEAVEALGVAEQVELGVMVETPAAAVTTALLSEAADFFSIGTNDLTQYALAMDRGNPATAPDLDALHPAVLRLIALACEGAAKGGRWIGVCGALASDPLAAPLLAGMGVTELSVTPAAIPELKARLRGATLEDCRRLADEALGLRTAREVRALLERAATPASSSRETAA